MSSKLRFAGVHWNSAGDSGRYNALLWTRAAETRLPYNRRGRFGGISHVRRLNTIGGTAPATAGAFVGDEARVPYTAEYYFYRAAK